MKRFVAAFLLILAALEGGALAADTKISALPAAAALTGVEAFPCVQSAATDKCTVTQAVTFTYSSMSGDSTATSGGVVTVTKTGGVAFNGISISTPGYIANNWYVPYGVVQVTGLAITDGSARCNYAPILQAATIGSLSANVTTVGTTNIQLAIYNNNATTHRPGTEIDHTASIVNTSTGIKTAALAGGNKALAAGGYWFCTNNNDAGAILVSHGMASIQVPYLGSATAANSIVVATSVSGVSTPVTFGTWGDLSGATWADITSARSPIVGFQVISTP